MNEKQCIILSFPVNFWPNANSNSFQAISSFRDAETQKWFAGNYINACDTGVVVNVLTPESCNQSLNPLMPMIKITNGSRCGFCLTC